MQADVWILVAVAGSSVVYFEIVEAAVPIHPDVLGVVKVRFEVVVGVVS